MRMRLMLRGKVGRRPIGAALLCLGVLLPLTGCGGGTHTAVADVSTNATTCPIKKVAPAVKLHAESAITNLTLMSELVSAIGRGDFGPYIGRIGSRVNAFFVYREAQQVVLFDDSALMRLAGRCPTRKGAERVSSSSPARGVCRSEQGLPTVLEKARSVHLAVQGMKVEFRAISRAAGRTAPYKRVPRRRIKTFLHMNAVARHLLAEIDEHASCH